jgi:hypothetical protein
MKKVNFIRVPLQKRYTITTTRNIAAAATNAATNVARIFEMTYTLIYLSLGLLSFWTMLHLDKECRAFVTDNWKSVVIAWLLWCLFWLPSLLIDALFWILEKREDKEE